MDVAVIGGSGTAGRSILGGLSSDLSVTAFSRTSPPELLPANILWNPVDVSCKEVIKETFQRRRVDTLIYAAAGQPIVSTYSPFSVSAMRRLSHRFRRRDIYSDRDLENVSYLTQTFDPEHNNLKLFSNVVEVLRDMGQPLQHIILLTGGMYYGIQTGPVFDKQWTGILTEESPRHIGENWYFDLEDYAGVIGRTLCPVTILRPSYILYEGGFVRQNLAHSIGIYLESQRRIGGKAVFPGGAGNYHCSWSFTPSSVMGRLVNWTIHRRDVWGQVFNSVAKTPVTWSLIWPQLAALYGLEVEVPAQPLSLGRQFRSNISGYPILAEHGYDPEYFTPLDFIDIAMVCDWNMVYSMKKAMDFGFDANADIFQPFVLERQRLLGREKMLFPSSLTQAL